MQADNEPHGHHVHGCGRRHQRPADHRPVAAASTGASSRYRAPENGGIAGTVTYDTTRNELDPAYAVTEDYQPGIPGLTMHLYYPLQDAERATCRPRRRRLRRR